MPCCTTGRMLRETGSMQGQIDTWPASADHLVEVAGLVMALSHIVALALIVLWFAMKKPTSLKLFRLRLRAAWNHKPLPERASPPGMGAKGAPRV